MKYKWYILGATIALSVPQITLGTLSTINFNPKLSTQEVDLELDDGAVIRDALFAYFFGNLLPSISQFFSLIFGYLKAKDI